MSIKKYIECQLADAELEEERLTAAVENKKEDECELDKIDAKIEAYEGLLRHIKQEEEKEANRCENCEAVFDEAIEKEAAPETFVSLYLSVYLIQLALINLAVT